MKREYGDYIEDIISSMNKAQAFIKDMDYVDFSSDEKTVFAVLRAFEIMGEAAKNIPESIRKKYPKIPWKDIAGMRDKLIHEYFGVKLELIWNTITKRVPLLKPKFKSVLKDLEKRGV